MKRLSRRNRAVTAAHLRNVAVEALENRTLFSIWGTDFTYLTDNPPSTPTDNCPPSVAEQQANSQNQSQEAVARTADPVTYAAGVPSVNSTDLQSDAFGKTWGITRSWVGASNSSQMGNGWMITSQPYLIIERSQLQGPSSHAGVVKLIQGGTNQMEFDVTASGTTFTARAGNKSKLEYVPSTAPGGTNEPGYFKLTDTLGNVTTFFDLPRAEDVILTDGHGKKFGSLNGNSGGVQQVTAQWFDSTTGSGGTASAAYRFGAFRSFTDSSTSLTVTTSYDSTTGNLTYVYRTDGSGAYERFHYTYATLSNDYGLSAPVISSVEMGKGTSLNGTYTTVRSAEYAYYTGDEPELESPHGRFADLKFVTIKNAIGNTIDQKYYRYYKFYANNGTGIPSGGFAGNQDTDPGGCGGTDATFDKEQRDNAVFSGLKMVVEGASFARLAANYPSYSTLTDSDPDTSTDANGDGNTANDDVKSYSNNYFRYERYSTSSVEYVDTESSRYRVIEEQAAGAGCSTRCSGFGTTKLFYEVNSDWKADPLNKQNSGLDLNSWVIKTTEYLSDATNADADSDGIIDSDQWADNDYQVVYTNELGQAMLVKLVDRKGTTTTGDDSQYLTYYHFDSTGHVDYVIHPSALTGYSESQPTLVDFDDNSSEYIDASNGLVEYFEYATSDSETITSSVPGDVEGYLKAAFVREGFALYSSSPGSFTKVSSQQYYAHEDGTSGAVIYPVASKTSYFDSDGNGTTDANTTNFSYTWRLDGSSAVTNRVLSQTTSSPSVSTSRNGSGSQEVSTTYFDAVGRPAWIMDEDGAITYLQYDNATGAVIKQIQDVDTDNTGDFSDKPSGWTNSGGLHLITNCSVDNLGRTTMVEDPNGNKTHTFYNDANHEVRVYPGWTGTNTTGPVQIAREYWATSGHPVGYTETLAVTQSFSGSTPTGNEAIVASNIQSLTRNITNTAGQVIEINSYTSLSGQTYLSTDLQIGTSGTHYLASYEDYDGRGRLKRTQDADGTITRMRYDVRGLLLSTWKGTDDTPTSGSWSPTNQGGTNLVKVSSFDYDTNGNQTISRQVLDHHGSTGADVAYYETLSQYDFRNRLVNQRGQDKVATRFTYDNVNNVTKTETYADADTDFVIDSTELRGKTEMAFDERGMVFRTQKYEVDPSTGAIPGFARDRLTTRYWYDGRGNLIKTKSGNGLFNKSAFDGAGRKTGEYVSVDSATQDSVYSDADDVAGDNVIEQTKRIYDKGGRVVTEWSIKRRESYSGTGELRMTDGSPTAPKADGFAEVKVYWYDQANRLITTANFGRDNTGNTNSSRYVFEASIEGAGDVVGIKDSDLDGIPDEAQSAIPRQNPSDTQETTYEYIVTAYAYGDVQRWHSVFDNKGKETRTCYDLAGRTTSVIHNYVDGTVGNSEYTSDVTTEYVYDAQGRLSIQRAKNPKGSSVENQDTTFLYEGSVDRSWVTNTIYPDSTDTASSGTDQVKGSYDRLGRKLTITDQNGTVHSYSYDSSGRLLSDAATTLGTGVDGAIRRIEYGYDDLSRRETITSYDAASGGAIKNQIKYTFDSWGNIIKSQQDHAGAVSGSSPNTQYAFADGAANGEAKYVRMSSYTNPNGNVITMNYSGISNFSDKLNRIDSISDGGTTLVEYYYSGAFFKIAETRHPGVNGGLTLAHGNPSGSDYNGFDRWGRIKRQQWRNTAGNTEKDRIDYVYDRNGNVLNTDQKSSGTSTNAIDSEYSYDALNRLSMFERGQLSSGTISTSVYSQTWGTLDGVGNWQNFTDDTNGSTSGGATTDARTHNKANELTESAVGRSQRYDNAGSLTLDAVAGDVNLDGTVNATDSGIVSANYGQTGVSWTQGDLNGSGHVNSVDFNIVAGQQGQSGVAWVYVHDAWNRMVEVKKSNSAPAATIMRYDYDGLGRRIRKDNPSGGTNDEDFYYNENYQLLEIRKNSDVDPLEQYVWDIRYIDAPILRYRDAATDGTMEETLYVTFDANYNVTGLWNPATGDCAERFWYTPYGKRTVLDANFAADADNTSDVGWRLGHQGLMHDIETGLINNRDRYLNSPLGRFDSRDPMMTAYQDGMNLYQYVLGNPIRWNDPSGKIALPPAPTPAPAPDMTIIVQNPPGGGPVTGTVKFPGGSPFSPGPPPPPPPPAFGNSLLGRISSGMTLIVGAYCAIKGSAHALDTDTIMQQEWERMRQLDEREKRIWEKIKQNGLVQTK